MNHYKWILFDADETLFHFDSFRGLTLMFSRFNVEFTNENYLEYQKINQPLWVEYQNGTISALQLQEQRFKKWSDSIQVTPKQMNSAFLAAMAEICTPLDGAERLLRSLHGKAKLGVITNGFVDLQQLRLQKTGLRDYFEVVIISEEVGLAKPHRGIFDHALVAMGNPDRHSVLMVGDNPHSDIQGGINAGLDTCWFNREGKPAPEGILPKYQISSLSELEERLLKTDHRIEK